MTYAEICELESQQAYATNNNEYPGYSAVDEDKSVVCCYCLEVVATGEDCCCDLCRQSLKEIK